MNSYNHYAYGSVIDWLYSVSAGINPDENNPGFKEVIIAPFLDKRLGSIKATLDTSYGKIESAWHYDGDTVYYEISTPIKATIIIDGEQHFVEKGFYTFRSSQNR